MMIESMAGESMAYNQSVYGPDVFGAGRRKLRNPGNKPELTAREQAEHALALCIRFGTFDRETGWINSAMHHEARAEGWREKLERMP